MFGPEGSEVDVLAYLSTAVHLDSFAFEFGKLKLDGSTGIGGWYFELKSELVSHEVVSIGADSLPLDAIFRGLHFEPVVVLLLIGFNIKNDSFKLFLEPVFPLWVLRACMNRQQGNLRCCFFDGAHHCCNYYMMSVDGEREV